MTDASAKARIPIIGDAVAPTGFARVNRSIFAPLSSIYELHQLATRYDGDAHDYPWTLYAANARKSVYGYDQIASPVERIEPALVFVLHDISFQVHYLALLKKPVPSPQIVVYSPVEAGPIAPEIVQQLHGVTRYVMCTEYGRSEIEESLQSVREQNPAFPFPALEVIPHGVDCGRFSRSTTMPMTRPFPDADVRRDRLSALLTPDSWTHSSCSTPIATCRASGSTSSCRALRCSRAISQHQSSYICTWPLRTAAGTCSFWQSDAEFMTA